MTKSVGAWVLDISDQLKVIVAEYQMYAYSVSASKVQLPLTPNYCNNLLVWEQSLLPVMDLAVLNGEPQAEHAVDSVVVVAYQDKPGAAIQYGAIEVYAAPQKITVQDTSASELPKNYTTKFLDIVTSCLSYQQKNIPIIEINHLFSTQFNELA